jgi:N-acetylglutamate synthase-like GNAT family acetyltransferase
VPGPEEVRPTRLRRARREDIPALLGVVGGPAAGRARALRRILKTLAADVYVLDRDRRIDGVVAVFYRRSLHEGGLVATIDALASFAHGEDGSDERSPGADAESLLEHAIERAKKRGCVAVHVAIDSASLRSALGERGFVTGPPHLVRALDSGASRADASEVEEGDG